jgi:hypothetical protein
MSIWNNCKEIYHRVFTTSGTRRMGRRRAIQATFHFLLLVRVLVSLHGILGIMNQYQDYDQERASQATTMHDLVEQLMNMPNNNHHLLLLTIEHHERKYASVDEQSDNQEEQEADIVFAFEAAQSVTQATHLQQHVVSCGAAHFAPSCGECPPRVITDGTAAAWWCNGQCEWNKNDEECVMKLTSSSPSSLFVHPDYRLLLDEYPFQPVTNENGTLVNVMLVRAPFSTSRQWELFRKYQDEILFLGISSHQESVFPLLSSSSSRKNPFVSWVDNKNVSSSQHDDDDDDDGNEYDVYRSIFPGFLTMMNHPEEYFDSSVKTMSLSQADFDLDRAFAYNDRSNKVKEGKKKLDFFMFLGADPDGENDCVVGWSSSFVAQALCIMCHDSIFNMTGVILAATKTTKIDNPFVGPKKPCSRLPDICTGKVVVRSSSILHSDDFFAYLSQSKFVFVPQLHAGDASLPRVVPQALAVNVPVLMNHDVDNASGWHYLKDQTAVGEFFHDDGEDMNDFQFALQKLLAGIDTKRYQPRKFALAHFYGNNFENHAHAAAGVKFKEFVMSHWGDRVVLPEGTLRLMPASEAT